MTHTLTALTICLTLALTAMTACDQSDAPPSATDGIPQTQPTTQPGSDAGNRAMHAASGPPAFNTACPLSGDPVDPKVTSVVHNDKVYGFCCQDCVDAFKANPGKYASAH
jgi:YHS domain-containing protein